MKKILILSASLLFSAACKEVYNPSVISTDHAYLVVEGFINLGTDSTTITLSRTSKVNGTARPAPELGAQVSIEGSDNGVWYLSETGGGNYTIGIGLSPAVLYRLHIVTSAGKEYRSDFVPAKISPPIDSLNWERTADGVQIYANTHDPQNASTYYRWNFSETWQFHAVYFSEFEFLPAQDTVVFRAVDSFYTCWKGDQSNTVLVGSSALLGKDLIYEAPITVVPNDSWKIGVEYSILVTQYVLTADAYNFWLNLQRNTEQIGGVFSPQPSGIKGNIHSLSDSTETVIGYISAGTTQQLRLFINPGQLSNWNFTSYTNGCAKKDVMASKESLLELFTPPTPYLIVDAESGPGFPPVYEYADKYCVDCTQVGTNVKPSYWP